MLVASPGLPATGLRQSLTRCFVVFALPWLSRAMRRPWLFQRPRPFPSSAILCTKRRAASWCRRCGACPVPQAAIHAPVRGLRLNRIRATGPGPRLDGHRDPRLARCHVPCLDGCHDPCLDGCHDPCLDGSHGLSLGGLHGLLRLMSALCAKRRVASWCRRCGACPAPQTAIRATPQHPGPNAPDLGKRPHLCLKAHAQVSAYMLKRHP